MHVSLRPAPRWPRIPAWSIGFVALWALIVIIARIVEWRTGTDLDTCLFHRLTGHPCPTCGTTRGLLAMARGDWKRSFLWNPLTMGGAVLVFAGSIGRAITAKTITLQMSQRERRLFLTIFLVLLGLNWTWLIYSQR
jgi:hypothetical protein